MHVYPIHFQWPSKDSLCSSKSIHINLLQEEPEMQELQLNIDGTHEGDCKKPKETFTEG